MSECSKLTARNSDSTLPWRGRVAAAGGGVGGIVSQNLRQFRLRTAHRLRTKATAAEADPRGNALPAPSVDWPLRRRFWLHAREAPDRDRRLAAWIEE